VRIAVIGSGISGLVCARLLSRGNDITLFEADSRIGGHTNTVSIEVDEEKHQIDTGFIVYNERTYPKFKRILSDLNVDTAATAMSFSVRCDRTGLEFNGTSPNGIFAQRRNLVRPSFLRMLKEITRFNREGTVDLANVADDQTVGDYLAEKGYSSQFAQQYLLPMGAAIWSCPYDDFARFPIRFILEFYVNHGLLSLRDRPTWRVIRGGSKEYVSKLIKPFEDRIRLNCPVTAVRRLDIGVHVAHAGGTETFDEVVFACHSDQALRLLADADSTEREILSAFPYSENTAVLHTDQSVLPRRRRAWASWNYHISREESSRPTVTYNMNILQQIQSKHVFSVTLNEDERIDPSKVLSRFRYSHPLFTTNRSAVQKRHGEVIRHRQTSFCGAYWRNGFHEDGVVSALAVCRKFGVPDWTADTIEPNRITRLHSDRSTLVGTSQTGVLR
jgi:predicted NAD/FAD-binding protein